MDIALQRRADMESAPTRYRCRSIRLKHYDYTQAGYYFVTIVAQGRAHLFGEIAEGKMVLNVAGEMVGRLWDNIPHDFPNVRLHESVIMPNHMHGIIEIVDTSVGVPLVGTQNVHCPNQNTNTRPTKGQPQGIAPTIGDIVGAYKSKTTNAYIQMVKNGSCPPFHKRIWQRNYYEHVIRGEHDYARLADYIVHNPVRWEEDMFANDL